MSPEFGMSVADRLAEAPIAWLCIMLLLGIVGSILKSIDNHY